MGTKWEKLLKTILKLIYSLSKWISWSYLMVNLGFMAFQSKNVQIKFFQNQANDISIDASRRDESENLVYLAN